MTRTPLGQRMLKQWFLRPSLSIDVINERQESVAVLLRPDNNHVLQNMAKSLKMVKNVPKILGQLKRGKGGAQRGGEWNALLSFVLHALKIRTAIQELVGSARVPIVKKVSHHTSRSRIGIDKSRSWTPSPSFTSRKSAK
jgi:DNA mismatch repair protein MSH5